MSPFSGLAWSIILLGVLWTISSGYRWSVLRWMSVHENKQKEIVRVSLLAHVMIYNFIFYMFEWPKIKQYNDFLSVVQAHGGCVLINMKVFIIPMIYSLSAWFLVLAALTIYFHHQTSSRDTA